MRHFLPRCKCYGEDRGWFRTFEMGSFVPGSHWWKKKKGVERCSRGRGLEVFPFATWTDVDGRLSWEIRAEERVNGGFMSREDYFSFFSFRPEFGGWPKW